MNKKLLVLLAGLVFGLSVSLRAQSPSVVVMIVLDQFPYDYIERYQPYFSDEGGFKYLLTHGANFVNAQYAHAFTKTAPGHAAISTGSYGHVNGIIANNWYDRDRKKTVGCVDDETVTIVGRTAKGRSPKNLLTFSVGDMIRLGSNFRSKVIGVSNKDRAAILLAGKFGTAYWIEDSLVVTSTYYMESTPEYVRHINSSGIVNKYFGSIWKESNPQIAGSVCDVDNPVYEDNWSGHGSAFPHTITGENSERISQSYYWMLDRSPFSTEMLLEIARTVFVQESLGRRGTTDMFCLGISATDEVGHGYGPFSHEQFDNVLRTDIMLGGFFRFLDKQIGMKNILFVLTSDHGIAPIPEFMTKQRNGIEAGRISSKEISKYAEQVLDQAFGNQDRPWVESVVESDIILNRTLFRDAHRNIDSAMGMLKDSLLRLSPIAEVFTRHDIEYGNVHTPIGEKIMKTFNERRSGDLIYMLKPYFIMSGETTGTNHGQPYSYDAHVPLMLCGRSVKPGLYAAAVSPVDIAPTLCTLLRVEFPPLCEGHVLSEALMEVSGR
jgi:predicted AlkP superfamily pyrophosphatase or phosphodiesterase